MVPVFNWLKNQSLETKLFSVILAIAILARIFMLFTMADAPLTDTLHHLAIVKEIAETGAIPFGGVPYMGVTDLPVPLYHFLLALPFMVFSIPFSLDAVRIFPFIFSALQLIVSYFLLKRIFPKNWVFGLAFVAIQPFLMIYGSVNYLETLASIFVLLNFYIYWRFVETGKNTYLWIMPFALAGLALSKESATFLVPAFFLAFLWELWKRKPKKADLQWGKKAAYFGVASVALSSAWFAINYFVIGRLSSSVYTGVRGLSLASEIALSLESIFLFPINFNAAFWFFMYQSLGSLPVAFSPEMATVAFTLITFPISMLILFGLARGVKAKEKHSLLLFFLLLFGILLLISRGRKFLHLRLIAPMFPLLGIAFSNAFKELKLPNWRLLLTIFFVLTAIYSIGFSSYYAWHFGSDYREHVPLYDFVKGLPDGSVVAIHSNKARQIAFIAEKKDIPHEYFDNLDAEQFKSTLKQYGVTHLAETCYKNPWDQSIIEQLRNEGLLDRLYSDKCNTLYEVIG